MMTRAPIVLNAVTVTIFKQLHHRYSTRFPLRHAALPDIADDRLSQKRRISLVKINVFDNMSIEWADDHFGLGFTKSIHF